MARQNNLAIVIPAYKSTFLAAALDSIAAQTCQDFTLYIGDDCSPNHLEDIVDRYRDKINLVYKRFDTNLGGKDLVAQWERCIDMTQDEEWLWLFSDDDVMEARCVEEFYKTKDKNSQLYHFNIKICDKKGRITKIPHFYPSNLQTEKFVDSHLFGPLVNAVVEFVFSRELYLKANKFENFDLAWGSDFITWVKFSALNNGITTIPKSFVHWRISDENISPNKSHDIVVRKLNAIVGNYVVLKNIFKKNNFKYSFRYDLIILKVLLRNRHYISKHEGYEVLETFGKRQGVLLTSKVFKILWMLLK